MDLSLNAMMVALVALIIFALLAYVMNTVIELPQPIKMIANVILLLIFLVVFLRLFGLF